MTITKTKGIALITGASTGIGAIYADRLADRGYDLILVARNQSRLDALAERLKSTTGRSVETIAADLNDKADLAKIEATLRANASITLLVNNAGVGAAGPLLNSDVEKMDDDPLNVGALTSDICRRASSPRRRQHHQYRFRCGDHGDAQWRLRWQQASAGVGQSLQHGCRQGCPRPSGPARRDGHGVLGRCRPAG